MLNTQIVGMMQIVKDQRLMSMDNQWSAINESSFAAHFSTALSFYNHWVVMTPGIFWNVITKTWFLVCNILSMWYRHQKQDISGEAVSLIMTDPWCGQIICMFNYTNSVITIDVV